MALPGFHVDVRTEFSGLIADINHAQRWVIPYALATALTKSAHDVRKDERTVMERVFDRPTRFTLNALYVQGANKNNLQASVEFKEGFNSVPAWRYLGPQIEGGPRKHKPFEKHLIRAGVMRPDEFAVPGLGAELDGHGNIAGRTIIRILSQLGAAENAAGYQANMTGRSKRRATRRAGGRYIVLRQESGVAGSKVFGRARAGIYFRAGAREIVPVLIFVRAPMYQKRYPYFATAQATINKAFPRHFREAWQSMIARRAGFRRAA